MTNPFDAASRDARLDPQDPSAKARLSAEAQRTGLRGAGFSITRYRIGWTYTFQGDGWGLPGVFTLSLRASDLRHASARPDSTTAMAMALSALHLPLPPMCPETPENLDLELGPDGPQATRYLENPLIWEFRFAPGGRADFAPRRFPVSFHARDFFSPPLPIVLAWFDVTPIRPAGFPQSWLPVGRELRPPPEGFRDLHRPSSLFPAVYQIGSSPDRILIGRGVFREEASTDPRRMVHRGIRLYRKLALGVFNGSYFASLWPRNETAPFLSSTVSAAYTAYEGRVETPADPADSATLRTSVFRNLAGWRAMSEDGLEIPILDRSPDSDNLNIRATRCLMNCRVRYRPTV